MTIPSVTLNDGFGKYTQTKRRSQSRGAAHGGRTHGALSLGADSAARGAKFSMPLSPGEMRPAFFAS